MKEKLRKINLNMITHVLKASLIGVVVSILLVLAFAFVLKFADLNSGAISLIDQIIKIVSIVVAVFAISKTSGETLLLKGAAVGAAYSIITFIVFSILNGGISFSAATLTDIVFSGVTGAVAAMVLNILRKK